MGFVLRAFLTGVAICSGLAVGEVLSKEINYQYNDFSEKRNEAKAKEEVITVID